MSTKRVDDVGCSAETVAAAACFDFLAGKIERLEAEVATLKQQVAILKQQVDVTKKQRNRLP